MNKPWLTNRRSLIILAVAMALVIWGNALWLRADKAPPAWDAARYLINSLEAFDLVRHPSVASLKELYFVRNTVRPSIGLVLPTMPIYLLFGVSDDAPTLWTNALFLAIIVFSVYGIGKRLFDLRVRPVGRAVDRSQPGNHPPVAASTGPSWGWLPSPAWRCICSC